MALTSGWIGVKAASGGSSEEKPAIIGKKTWEDYIFQNFE